jgi:Lar family restriction alleviation protein
MSNKKCLTCGGSGVIQEYDDFDDRYVAFRCPQCDGSGVINDNELKSCPFCGGEAEIHNLVKIDINDRCWIECKECGISTKIYDGEQEAIEAWNRRVE